jgi:copper(I)-binding protein
MALLAAVSLVVAACGGDEAIRVDDAWARTSPRMAEAGAIYLDITSADGDRMISASVADSVAGSVEIHETVMADMGDDADQDMGGAMMMQEVGEITLPAGETISLEPGGLHIMLLDLTEPFESGDTFEVVLSFDTAQDVTVEVEVRDQ